MSSISQHPYLAIRGGSSHGVVIHIRKAITTVGRHGDADIVIDDPTISRRHAEITLSDDKYFLLDLGSTNGSFVNQHNIGTSEYRLTDGDEISFGLSQVTLTFRNTDLSDVMPRESKITESLNWSRLVIYRRDE